MSYDYSKYKLDKYMPKTAPVADLEKPAVKQYGSSLNKSTVNSIHTYDLGGGVEVKIETQTGLCNVTALMQCLAKLGTKSDTRLKRFFKVKKYQPQFKEFDKAHAGEVLRVYTGSEVKLLEVKATTLSGDERNRVVWLHKELMPFYLDWLKIEGNLLGFNRVVYDTKMSYLRDQSAKMYKSFSKRLEQLPYDDNDGGMIGPRFSNKLSKMVFGFNDDQKNQWDEATDDQLMLRVILLGHYNLLIMEGRINKWSDLQDIMNDLGKKMWFYWSGSAGKRRLKNNQLEIVRGY